jgi:uncharacterized membrane protein YfcA
MTPERRREWSNKLGRFLMNPEPLDVQLAASKRVVAALTGVVGAIASIIVAIFTAFGRVDVGLVVAGLILLPIVVFAWMGQLRRSRLVAAYLREMRQTQPPPMSKRDGEGPGAG